MVELVERRLDLRHDVVDVEHDLAQRGDLRRQGGDLIAPRSSDESFDRRHAGRIPTPIASLRLHAGSRAHPTRDQGCGAPVGAAGGTGRAGDGVVADEQGRVEGPVPCGAARSLVQRVSLERVGVPRDRPHRVGHVPAVRIDRPRSLSPVVLHPAGGQDARRPGDRDQPASRRRVPLVHAAVVLVPHERLRPERPSWRHPDRPPADRPPRRGGRRGAHAARARARPRHGQGA